MRKLLQIEFLEKVRKIHGNDTYDLSLAIYVNNRSKVTVICHKHGPFTIKADSLMQGNECRECSYEKRGMNKRLLAKVVIEKFQDFHKNKYDYDLVVYSNMDTKVKIVCPIHGIFEQTPYNHMTGQGCVKCVFIVSLEQFLKKSNEIHKGKYDYSLVDYLADKIVIICPAHGMFEQSKHMHLQGRGCPSCSHVISRPEIAWLDFLKIPLEHRHKSIVINSKKYNVDAFDPVTNIVYEFYGDFWHGNPEKYPSNSIHSAIKNKTYGEVYLRTMNREVILKNAGYNLCTIWEGDFNRLKSGII